MGVVMLHYENGNGTCVKWVAGGGRVWFDQQMRYAYVDHKNRFVLLWNPKCACTSLGEWFAFGIARYDQGQETSTAPFVLRARQEYGVGFEDAARYMRRGYASAAFTRDPFDRAVSAYVSKFVLNYGRFVRSFDQLEEFAKPLYLGITGQTPELAAANYKGITFLEYLTFIELRVRERAGQEPRLNQHWNTQTPFLFAESGLRPTEVFDISNLKNGIDAISRRFGYSTITNWANRTARAEHPDHGFLGDVPSLRLAADSIVPTADQLRSNHTAELAAMAYAIDYDYLGYSLPECLISS